MLFEYESMLVALHFCNIIFTVSSFKNPIDKDTIKCLPVWCTDFVDLHHQILLELIDAGVLLKIDQLVDLVSLKLSIIVHVSLMSFRNDL